MGFPIYILFLIPVFLCVHGIGVESGGQRQRCGSSWAWSSEIQPEGLTVDAGSFSCPCFASMGLQMYPTTAGFLCGCWGPLPTEHTPASFSPFARTRKWRHWALRTTASAHKLRHPPLDNTGEHESAPDGRHGSRTLVWRSYGNLHLFRLYKPWFPHL